VNKETPYNPKDHKKQDNPVLEEFGSVHLAQNEKEELLHELFLSVATTFLWKRIEQRHHADLRAIQEEKRRKFKAEKAEYENLSKEEKEKRLLEGLYNYK